LEAGRAFEFTPSGFNVRFELLQVLAPPLEDRGESQSSDHGWRQAMERVTLDGHWADLLSGSVGRRFAGDP
jgi:hypothetical protein